MLLAMRGRAWILLGCSWAALGVVLGAFGAHYLKDVLAPEPLANWDTAVRYQLVHALALIAFGLFGERSSGRDYPGILLLLGSFLFSGSIYSLCFGFLARVMGPLTPLGGLLMILGWVLFAREAVRRR
jgi:uncharacterized membrane protein YgdD (TMEM256/DUF423 family)